MSHSMQNMEFPVMAIFSPIVPFLEKVHHPA